MNSIFTIEHACQRVKLGKTFFLIYLTDPGKKIPHWGSGQKPVAWWSWRFLFMLMQMSGFHSMFKSRLKKPPALKSIHPQDFFIAILQAEINTRKVDLIPLSVAIADSGILKEVILRTVQGIFCP
jgi:hypothetical protein